MAFMFIVTILVIAICRVHIKRTIVSRCPLNHQHLRPGSPLRPQIPLYDIDMFLDHHSESHPGLLVTYNINNGVQFVGRPVDPPPYCEVIDSPPREGPPPPYVSRENVNTQEERTETAELTDEATIETPCDIRPDIKDEIVQNASEEICSSPSVSGINNNANKKRVVNDSDSESDSMESDALLSEAIERKDSKTDDETKRSSSTPTPPSFLNNIIAVSKTLTGSLKRNEDRKRQLITQKSFDSSEPCDLKCSSAESGCKVTHSVGDLSPVNADFDRIDFLTLPLRESFIGVRNDDV